jgi:hypothetical protein
VTPRKLVALSLALAIVAVLGSQILSYGLVYPAAAAGKWPLAAALAAGATLASVSGALSWHALRRSAAGSERFVAGLGLALSGFLLFVVLFGFGIPDLFLGVKD